MQLRDTKIGELKKNLSAHDVNRITIKYSSVFEFFFLFFLRIEQGRWLTTSNANKMTPQLQTSAFLPSYFSPCAAMTQRLKNVLTSKWIHYPRRTREGRMGNHTFWSHHLLPKMAFPTRRARHSPLIVFCFCFFVWTAVYIYLGSARTGSEVGNRAGMARTGNFLVVILKQMWRCIKGIKNVFFSFLVLQGACHQSHYLWTHSIGWTVSSVCMFALY